MVAVALGASEQLGREPELLRVAEPEALAVAVVREEAGRRAHVVEGGRHHRVVASGRGRDGRGGRGRGGAARARLGRPRPVAHADSLREREEEGLVRAAAVIDADRHSSRFNSNRCVARRQ